MSSTATEIIERGEGRQGLASMIRRVKIRNYKSIKSCDVELKPFTILVGRNGSGKSNFLDAIRFVAEGTRPHGSLPQGYVPGSVPIRIYPWTGLNTWVLDTEPPPAPVPFQIALDLDLPCGDATYEVAVRPRDHIRTFFRQETIGAVVERERLEVRGSDGSPAHYEVAEGRLIAASADVPKPEGDDRLLLARLGESPAFAIIHDALSAMNFHDLRPDVMRHERGGSGGLLARDGNNLTSVLRDFHSSGDGVLDRITEWMGVIVPGVAKLTTSGSFPMAHLIVEQRLGAYGDMRRLSVHGLSDGTLRALGILVAINQLAPDGRPIRLVGIEEPETALHPAAAGALMDAFRDAACHTQVLVTTHGADLLDRFDPEEDHILAVELRDGRTEIGPVNPASRDAIREHLFSAGELLRMDQLHPDRLDVERQAATHSARPNGRP